MHRGRQLVFTAAGTPLECRTVEVPAAPPGGVVVRTTIAGVCGTDAHRLRGDLPAPPAPVCFGHEGIGTLAELGSGVTTDWAGEPVTVGDAVYWAPSGARPAAPPSTGWPPPADVPSPAAYQDFATLAPSNLFYKVPDDVPAESVIAFGCAMPTALGGMARLGGIRPGQTVVVQGCGPVGLATTVLAGLSAARDVVVIGGPAARRDAAAALGATGTVPLEGTTAAERAEAVLELTGGRRADVVVEAAGVLDAFGEGMDLLADGGRLVILGLYSGGGTVPFDPVQVNNRSLTIIGSLGPSAHDDHRTTIDLARRFERTTPFSRLVTHRFPLERTADAIAVAGAGEAIKALVVL